MQETSHTLCLHHYPHRAHSRFTLPSFFFTIFSISLIATLKEFSVVACVLVGTWCVVCLTQDPAGWALLMYPVPWDTMGWLNQLRAPLDSSMGAIYMGFSILPYMDGLHIASLDFLTAWRSQGRRTSYPAAGFLPERKQKLTGLWNLSSITFY